MRRVVLAMGWLCCSMTTAAAQTTSTTAALTIREAKNGEIEYRGPVDHLTHRFTITALTADPATVLAVNVPDLTDGTGKQIPTRWAWIGAPPKTIDLRTPAEILIEAPLPAPATYSTTIEVIYATKDAAGNDAPRPLRVPLRFERTPAAAVAMGTELPVATAAGNAVEVELGAFGSATADVELALRGSGTQPILIDKMVFLAAPRKAGNQLVKNAATATVKESFPITISPQEIRELHLGIAGLDEPGIYEAEVLLGNSTSGATKEVTFTILAKRRLRLALVLITGGVAVSWLTRLWLQRDRARAVARRELGHFRDALSRLLAGVLGDTERNAASSLAGSIRELVHDIDEDKPVTDVDAAIRRLRKRIVLLQAVVDARRIVALLPLSHRVSPALSLESIAGAVTRDLDDPAIQFQQDELQKLDLERALRSVMNELAGTLRERLDTRSAAHPELQASWVEIRGHLDAVDRALKQDHVLEARGALMTGYRLFTRQLGALLRALVADPPPQVESMTWGPVRSDVERFLDELDQTQDTERAAELHASALTRFLRSAVPALAAAARNEASDRPSAAATFDALAGKAEALLAQPRPDTDDVYRAVLLEHVRLVATTQKQPARSGLELIGAAPAPAAVQVPQIGADSRLSVLRTVLPSTEVLAARIKASNRAADLVLFSLAVATGVQILWMGNATWGNEGDILAAVLWGAGVHSVGQQVARGVLGLEKDFLKSE